MAEQKIVIKIDPKDGKTSIKTDGFTGDQCLSTIQDILGDLVQLENYKPKPEFYQSVQVKQKERIQIKK